MNTKNKFEKPVILLAMSSCYPLLQYSAQSALFFAKYKQDNRKESFKERAKVHIPHSPGCAKGMTSGTGQAVSCSWSSAENALLQCQPGCSQTPGCWDGFGDWGSGLLPEG